ncbi:MAG TPA: O-antigen ligase family protein [Bryobacteraceae bacterium]|nr:O-antigen ligase family protein [Bryobacteraceae bacterium]
MPLLTSFVALIGAAADGRLFTTLKTRIGAAMMLLTCMYAINIPFSSWRGQSLHIFTDEWMKSFTAFLLAGAVVVTFQECRTALNSIGWGAGIASLITLYLGRGSSGRLQTAHGTLSNSNEIAFLLLLGLPFLALMVLDKDAAKLKRMLAFFFAVSSLYALVRTGSRAGLLGLAILGLMTFFRVSVPAKLAMIVAAGVLAAGVVVVMPGVAKRYATMFRGSSEMSQATSAEEAHELDMAINSTQGRRQLLVNSIKLTLQHPITGVGMGAFGAVMAEHEISEGQHAGFQGTHNTYTQISSEAGIPALLCFVCIILFSMLDLRAVYKRARGKVTKVGKQIADVSFALIASLVAYAVCVAFDFVAYNPTLPILAGFAIALSAVAQNALDAADYAESQPQPATRTILMPMRGRSAMAQPRFR